MWKCGKVILRNITQQLKECVRCLRTNMEISLRHIVESKLGCEILPMW